ncbi:MAG: DNA repair protein RadA [Bacteroidetes bacterium]|nr:DNA repair protein RadA [Bacteroidota bacterium]MDA1332726.1 DNA repair protein RadA [Bacteroidota bacterium]
MAKIKSLFFCQDCGNESPRWMGQCPACSAWNSMVEERTAATSHKPGLIRKKGGITPRPLKLSEIRSGAESRLETGNAELDRVLGGGIVEGSVVLIAGDPGIGKSTLMTELATLLGDVKLLYVTGEESPSQVKMRAERMGVDSDRFLLLAETEVESIIRCVQEEEPTIMVVDSIQTIFRSDLTSAPGSVTQVRESAAALIQMAKSTGTATFIVGHVTKSGTIAGPRVLEHMVDTVLYLEGDRHHVFRILRAVKNRFGSTNEIGVFEMESKGLTPVDNPSELFLSDRNMLTPGSAVVCSLEGTRPMLAEIQALVTPTSYSNPQRTANGFEGRRLQMLLAVLEKRVGMPLSTCDVFVNVTGGLRLTEPAADLAIAAAIASSFRDIPIPSQAMISGEVGLGGEVRAISQLEARLLETSRLGFSQAFVPEKGLLKKSVPNKLECIGLKSLEHMMSHLF